MRVKHLEARESKKLLKIFKPQGLETGSAVFF